MISSLRGLWRDFRAWTLQERTDALWLRVGISAWTALIVGLCAYSLTHPGKKTVSLVYWIACWDWWSELDMYLSYDRKGLHGYLYFPQAAILATPFAFFPLGIAEALWRLVNLGLLAFSLARVCRMIAPARWRLWFGLSTLLAIPAAGLSAQNGNTNIIMLALMALACVDVSANRWWRAASLLVLAIALKPQAIILTMLLAAIYPRQMIGRLAVSGLVMAALPWIFPNWKYVWFQHQSCLHRLTVAYAPPPGSNQDLAGLLVSMHITLSDRVWLLLRAFAAAATLGLSWLASRRFERSVSVVYVLALAVLYNLIFNPRSEGATHALIAITIGIFAAREIIAKPGLLAWSMVGIAVMIGVSHYVMGPLNPWVRPLLAVVVMGYVIVRIARNRPGLPCAVPRE